jgi:hypothetical protein
MLAIYSPRQGVRGLREWTEDIRTALSQAQWEERRSPRLDAEELARFLLDAYEGGILRARAL